MSAEAREVVAAAIWDRKPTCDCDRCVSCCEADADALLAALRPFIAAEIRAWADLGLSAPLRPSNYQQGVTVVLNGLKSDADPSLSASQRQERHHE